MSFADQPLLRRRLRFPVFLSLLFIALVGAAFFFQYLGSSDESTNGVGIFVRNFYSDRPLPFYVSHRKILQSPPGNKVETDRIWVDKCSASDILITQGPTDPLPNGIPTYTVEISNVCPTGCDISGIHLNCGWFSSARLINPRIFKRLRYDDCLVNDGHPLTNGRTISFQYANTFSYRLSVSSVNC